MAYGLDDITINTLPPNDSGHAVFKDCVGPGVSGGEGKGKALIYKINKGGVAKGGLKANYVPLADPQQSGNPEASINEAAFSELAKLFMGQGLTPSVHLVRDNAQKVTGIAIENIQYAIKKRHPDAVFYCIDYNKDNPQQGVIYTLDKDADKLSFKFLDQLPPGHFSALLAKHKVNSDELTIDMESLASCLGTSYMLEEDDLHKGNLGYYVVDNNGHPQVVFFKIDHDLMMSESIMSHVDPRVANWVLGDDAFTISRWDLKRFPDLYYSQNHYWPTKLRFMVPYGDDKVYTHEERQAFRDLADDADFIRAKWKHFLKYVLISNELMVAALSQHLDERNEDDRARISMISNAVTERQAKLQATLFSIPEFVDYVNGRAVEDIESIQVELVTYMQEINWDESQRTASVETIKQNAARWFDIYTSKVLHPIDKKDTPLHVAIRQGNYRFDETNKTFGRYWHRVNSKGEKPMDLIVQQVIASWNKKNSKMKETAKTPSEDTMSVLRNALYYGAHLSTNNLNNLKRVGIDNKTIKTYRFDMTGYWQGRRIECDGKKINYQGFLSLIRTLSEDSSLSLKTKKIWTINLAKQHSKNWSCDELSQFKYDLQAKPCLRFVKQLRSQLWFVRWWRGLYGNSHTLSVLNKMIDSHKKALEPPCNRQSPVLHGLAQQMLFFSCLGGCVGASMAPDRRTPRA